MKIIINDVKSSDSIVERLLIGNKNDCSNRQVYMEEAEKWALENEIAYLDFTAETNVRESYLVSWQK